MPWIKVDPMDSKVLFIADYLRNTRSFASLCRTHGISRKTGYKWVHRYKSAGFDGLSDHSCRPHHFPNKIAYRVRKEVIELRKRYRSWGAKKIREILLQYHSDWDIPSRTSVYNIIKAGGLVRSRRRRRRVSPISGCFLRKAQRPNELWTADFKGQFLTGDGEWCYPLTIMDYASRYLLACEIVTGTRYQETRAVFERVFQKHGMPERIRTDNGVPFASISVGGLSRLSVWWISLGIVPERIEQGKPQQNGCHERMHRTLKQETACPPASSLSGQQRRFDEFSKRYNEERPHEAIGMVPPKAVYQASGRRLPGGTDILSYPKYYDKRLVNHNGCIWVRGETVYLGYLLHGKYVGIEEVEESEWKVYYGPIILGLIKKGRKKGLIMTRCTEKV